MASNANPAVKSVTADLRITLVTLASQRNHFRQTIGGSNSGAGAITSNGQTQSAVSLSAVDLSTQKDLVVTARLSFAGPSMRLLAADLVRRPLTDPHTPLPPLPGSRSPGRVCQQTARSEPVQSTSTTLAPSLMRLRPFHRCLGVTAFGTVPLASLRQTYPVRNSRQTRKDSMPPSTPAAAVPQQPLGGRTGKDLSLESLRGLALLLMVAGHVIGQTADRGMQVADDSGWRFAYLALADIRMPLFTFLSGYVFATRPAMGGADYPRLITGKARRVLLPLLTVGTLLFTLQLVVPGTNAAPEPAQWWRTYVFGFEHLWFLQAIFLVFLAVGALEVVGALTSRRRWGIAFIASLVTMWFLRIPTDMNVFSLNEAAYLLPFFLLGYGISRYRPPEPASLVAGLTAVCAVTLAARLLAQVDSWRPAPWQARALGILVGVSFVLLLFALRRWLTTPALYWLGPFAFGVYLLHPFGTAATRMLLGRGGIDAPGVVFLCAMAAGVAGPVVAQRLARRAPPLHIALFGEKNTAGIQHHSPSPPSGKRRAIRRPEP